MQKRNFILVLLATLVWWGCSEEEIGERRVSGVSVDITEKTVVEGDVFQLVATVFPENAENKEIKWRSTNDGIATVDDEGNVTAVGQGEVRIVAVTRDRALTAQCVLTVEEKIFPVVAVSFEQEERTLTVGDLFAMVPLFTPENASNQNVAWKSSNEEVAEVTVGGIVLAKMPGTTTITVTTEDGGKTAQCVITVEKAQRPKLAIEYVTEYNVNPEGTGFVDNHSNEAGGYFNWEEALSLFAVDKNFSIDGIGYHLPSRDEWKGIVPSENGGNNVQFVDITRTDNFSEGDITIAGETKSYQADYRGAGNGVSYGLRFKGQDETHRSAWRYEFIDNPNGGKMMRVTVRYLGPDNLDITVDDFANADWWNQDNSDDIIRIFPAAGYRDGDKINLNNQGTYSSSTEAGNTARNMRMYFTSSTANGSSNQAKTLGFSVRLFFDN